MTPDQLACDITHLAPPWNLTDIFSTSKKHMSEETVRPPLPSSLNSSLWLREMPLALISTEPSSATCGLQERVRCVIGGRDG